MSDHDPFGPFSQSPDKYHTWRQNPENDEIDYPAIMPISEILGEGNLPYGIFRVQDNRMPNIGPIAAHSLDVLLSNIHTILPNDAANHEYGGYIFRGPVQTRPPGSYELQPDKSLFYFSVVRGNPGSQGQDGVYRVNLGWPPKSSLMAWHSHPDAYGQRLFSDSFGLKYSRQDGRPAVEQNPFQSAGGDIAFSYQKDIPLVLILLDGKYRIAYPHDIRRADTTEIRQNPFGTYDLMWDKAE